MWLDHDVSKLEAMSRDDLIVLARRQDAQIIHLAEQLADLMNRFEAQAAKLASLEHLLSRNSSNSSTPPSRDDEIGRKPPKAKPGRTATDCKRGGQKGADGTQPAWREEVDDHEDRFPTGRCGCGADLADGLDLGVVDRYQQHEIPPTSVKVTQYDSHAVACRCGKVHTAKRPEGAGKGRAEYGPNLKAFAVYLLVVHFLPVKRCCELLAALTGAEPSPGFVHAMIAQAAALVKAIDDRIRALITCAYAVCLDETPLEVGSATPAPGKKKAEVPAGGLHRAVCALPARRPLPGHLQGVCLR